MKKKAKKPLNGSRHCLNGSSTYAIPYSILDAFLWLGKVRSKAECIGHLYQHCPKEILIRVGVTRNCAKRRRENSQRWKVLDPSNCPMALTRQSIKGAKDLVCMWIKDRRQRHRIAVLDDGLHIKGLALMPDPRPFDSAYYGENYMPAIVQFHAGMKPKREQA